MDFLEREYLDARSPYTYTYDYTFNFWNDYLGLSTLVAKSKINGPPCSPNSITESLKATLGLEDEHDDDDDPPLCPCVVAHGRDADGHFSDSSCCCCCAAPGSPPISIYELRERISLLRPYGDAHGGQVGQMHQQQQQQQHHQHQQQQQQQQLLLGGGGGGGGGESPFSGLDLLALERRRKQAQRSKPEPKVCVFCRNNGAPEEVYGTHILKTADGRVLCPILRAYTCPLCSANGDNAHTIKYCPLSKDPTGQRVAKGGRAAGKRLKIF
ncbi:unnamed protein product [Ophioblennius macclurei]